MRMLVVAPWVPGGVRKRSWELLERLSSDHELLIVVASWGDCDRVHAAELSRFGHVEVVSLGKFGAILRAILALIFTRRFLQQAYVSSRRLQRVVVNARDTFRPEIVFFNALRGSGFVDQFDDICTVFDLDDIRSDHYDAMRRTRLNPVKRVRSEVRQVGNE